MRLLCLLAFTALAYSQTVRITDPVEGAILNRHDGGVRKGVLTITVRGESGAARVKVNGVATQTSNGRFECRVPLRAQENRIVAEAGGARHAVTVLWDRNSRPRYRFSIDDNIWFLKDIALHTPAYRSIFENPYLAMYRDLHRKYGTRFHFNIYYETDGFNLSQMPDRYRAEWRANADWIRLTFHARADKPDRPYLGAPADGVLADYRQVTREIERFAGKELLSPATTIHWGEATRETCAALRKEGVRILAGYFQLANGAPIVSYYLDRDRTTYLSGRDYWKDTALDLLFVRHDIVLNSGPIEQIVPKLDKVGADPHQSEVIELMIHEQYFYPAYRNYLKDYRQRMERALDWVSKRGYQPVFYSNGFLGSPR
jgi:hypothetical protein